ncbi:MAG: hypothetical protein HZA93_23945 [Verrucomicrobia bacterium]|nr:hypothetical protein [Verrucomicrobiota bacterium]
MPLQLPREPRSGDAIEASDVAQIIRYLRSITPRSGAGVMVSIQPGGTTFAVTTKKSAVAGDATDHPFLVRRFAAAKVTVVFGQVNSITPTIGGTAIGTDPAPQLTIAASGVVYLDATLDVDGVVTAVAIATAAALPASTATHAYLTLATVTFASGAITALAQSVTHSLGHQKCGETTHNFWGL